MIELKSFYRHGNCIRRVARTPCLPVAQRQEVISSLRIARQLLNWATLLEQPLLFLRNPEAVASGPPRAARFPEADDF
jgi:hypothetical protein